MKSVYFIDRYMYEKLKHFLVWFDDDLNVTILVVLLVGVSAFGLGRMSVSSQISTENVPGIDRQLGAEASMQTVKSAKRVTERDLGSTITAGDFVASRNGTKYHALTCPGAKQISDKNKIYFLTEDQAMAAGYTRAANCPGL